MSRSYKVLVVGDVFIDKYTYGEVGRLAPDFPGLIFEPFGGLEDHRKHTKLYAGGAGNVANNIKTLIPNADVHLMGSWQPGMFSDGVLSNLHHHRISDQGMLKERLVVCSDDNRDNPRVHQKLMRIDYGKKFDTAATEIPDGFDLIVYSDYNKGTIQWGVTPEPKAPITLMDSKNPTAMSHWPPYMTAMKMNSTEWEAAASQSVSTTTIVTYGRKPVYLTQNRDDTWGTHIPVYDINVAESAQSDFSGAGDTFMAGLVYAHYHETRYPTWEEKIRVANVAAAIAVSKKATSTVTLDEISNELIRASDNDYI